MQAVQGADRYIDRLDANPPRSVSISHKNRTRLQRRLRRRRRQNADNRRRNLRPGCRRRVAIL